MILAILKNTMKGIINLLGILITLSLMMVTSQASAELKVTNKAQVGSSQKDYALRSAVKSLDSGDPSRDWHDTAIERLLHLRVDDILIGRFILSIDNGLKVNTPISDNTMTRVTFGKSDITVLPYTKRYNLGLGFTSPLSKRLSIDTSVNFALSGPSDAIFWVSLPAIRF
ncbi:MAG: hypothetical protein HZB32_04680 [Nitrospirae bacterium]|nr:hypothetical protein [Nitrospirota bacterium]